MSTPEDTPGRSFSVKEILTEFVLPRLNSIDEKLDKKADASEMSALQMRLEMLERTYVTREEKHAMQAEVAARDKIVSARISGVESWRNRLAGGLAVITITIIPLAALVLTHFSHP